ncbi:MAG: HAMP domain-containing histidine kinase [Bryobacterales bacterium]|nr:HAMP domain-containing histidine kinase [Bryobacterales bacterium]
MEWDWRSYLFPGDAEQDEGFRSELTRQAVSGLKIIGAINIAVTLFLLLARFVIERDPGTLPMRVAESTLAVLLGVASLLIARTKWIEPRARLVGMIFGFLTATVLIWFSLCLCELTADADDFIPGQITMVMLVGIAALPLKPVHSMIFGGWMLGTYVISAKLAEYWALPLAYLQSTYVLFIFTLTLLATALTAIVYAQRSNSYFRYQQALKAERDLQEIQRRMMLSENAASLGRLAAALSHELNSPVGALSSGVDTLVLLSARQSTNPMEPQRFVMLLNDLRKTVQDASSRLGQIVARMQRIANLDRSEIQKVRLNELLNDVIVLADARLKEKADLDVALDPVPAIICRPQQLSAVFRNLLNNSVDALNGDGRIRVASHLAGESIEIEIADNGKGMKPEELEALFDPGFRVAEGRVSTGNWSMFSSRQVVREHGGDIAVESCVGKGTTVRVTFPLQKLEMT